MRPIGATYARISTAKQKEGISLDQQDTRMAVYTEQVDIIVPQEYRFKEQESGYKQERSEYDRIRSLIRERKIQVLIVYGSDRQTRDLIHGEIFRSELRRNRVALHIITEGGEVDIVTPTGQFMRRQMDNFNWYWGKMVQQTTIDKKREYAEHGIPLQQGIPPFGYKRVGKKMEAKLELVPEEAAIVKRVLDLLAEGYSPSRICGIMHRTPTPGDMRRRYKKRAFGDWRPAYIYRLAHDEVYTGVYYGNRYEFIEGDDGKKRNKLRPREEWKPCVVPAIITREQYDHIHRLIETGNNRQQASSIQHEYLLARRVRCKHCQYRVSGLAVRSKNLLYYRCNSTSKSTAGEPCRLGNRRVDEVDATVWAFTVKLLKDPTAMLAAMREAQRQQMEDSSELTTRLSELDTLIAEKRQELEQLVISFRQAKGAILLEALQREADRISEIIAGLETERNKLSRKVDSYVLTEADVSVLQSFAARVYPVLDTADFETKRMVIETLDFTFVLENSGKTTVIYLQWYVHNFILRVGDVLPDFLCSTKS